MNTTSIARRHRRGLAGLALVSAAAISAGHEIPTSRFEVGPVLRQAGALDYSRDLLALHRLADPSLFRCYLCRLTPEFGGAAALRVNDSAADCDASGAGMRQL